MANEPPAVDTDRYQIEGDHEGLHERRFPMQSSLATVRTKTDPSFPWNRTEHRLPAGSIPWRVAERIYREVYAPHYSQSLERLAERGGFGWNEVAYMYIQEERRRG